jgi:hypothetical protein
MFPVAPFVVIIAYSGFAILGAMIGVVGGWLISLMTKCGPQGILRNAGFGALGFMIGFLACIFISYPRYVITYRFERGTAVTSTTDTCRHPERVAVVMAVLLPLTHEVFRLRQSRANFH